MKNVLAIIFNNAHLENGNEDEIYISTVHMVEYAVKNKNLSAYTHDGFWKCMDTKRDKDELEKIYKKKKFF